MQTVISERPKRPVHKTPERILKKAAKDMIMPYRRLTGAARIMPDFIIIGAQKCGTTSLYRYLAAHPQVIRSFKKEIDFFDRHYHQGSHWYRSHFPYGFHRRLWSRWLSRRCITGEASTNYILDPLAPFRTAQLLPDVRIIAILRNPVERAYSHYRHRIRYWQESRTFEAAVSAEEEQIHRQGYRHLLTAPGPDASRFRRRSYLLKGMYAAQLSNWREYFGANQMCVIKAEELFTRPEEAFSSILDFLDLDPWSPPVLDAHNSFSYRGMAASSRDRLEMLFRPHNEELRRLLGDGFAWD